MTFYQFLQTRTEHVIVETLKNTEFPFPKDMKYFRELIDYLNTIYTSDEVSSDSRDRGGDCVYFFTEFWNLWGGGDCSEDYWNFPEEFESTDNEVAEILRDFY